MSRIGVLPIDIPEKVNVKIDNNSVTVKGPEGELTKEFNPRCTIKREDNQIIVERASDSNSDRALHGMARSIIYSMIEGVVEGYEKKLEMVGVGYSAQVKGKNLELEVGYSHPITIEAPENVEFEVEKNTNITVRGIDKQQVGNIAARIRDIRKPEPYKGKGIRYSGEHIRRKEGKTG